MADVCIVTKVDSAPEGTVDEVLASVPQPEGPGLLAASPIEVEGGGDGIHGKRVLCIEDGHADHGDMTFGRVPPPRLALRSSSIRGRSPPAPSPRRS
jgi:predicted GTPase